MKNSLTSASVLDSTLENEINILTDMYHCQKRMYESVLVRDWVLLQKETAISERLADTFLNLENDRISFVRKEMPGIDGSLDFYQVTATFPEPERSRINARFREMKKLLLLSKTENEVFNTYIANARTIVSGMLETVIPARRNKIYSRHGNLVTGNVESLVVNRSF